MDVANRRSLARARARARTSAKFVESIATAKDVTGNDAGGIAGAVARGGNDAGAVAGGIESGYWWNQIPLGYREKNVHTIMLTLKRLLPGSSEERLQKLGAYYERKICKNATSYENYSRKMTKMMSAMEAKFPYRLINYLHPNVASNGQSAHGPEMTMEATSYKTTSGPEESDDEQATEENNGDASKQDVVEDVVVTKEQNYVVGRKENVRVIENKISCGLSSGAKLDEHLAQVEERLEKVEAHSEQVETLLVGINEKLNYLVKMQDRKVSRVIRRPAKYMSSSWTSNVRSKRKGRVAEMIRPSCKHQ